MKSFFPTRRYVVRKRSGWIISRKIFRVVVLIKEFHLQVHAEIEQIESDDVVSAISAEIRQHMINKLVIGVSSRPLFSRYEVCVTSKSIMCDSLTTNSDQ